MSVTSSGSVWECRDMPLLDEEQLALHGHLTIEQFHQEQCKAQIAILQRHAASLTADLRDKLEAAQRHITSIQTNAT